MAFQFQEFTVEDRSSTLRVGTDAMLLGAWADPGGALRILDIGTGCGVLALMVAQRSEAGIVAIEPDQPSAEEAAMNFSLSPWAGRLQVHQTDLQTFAARNAASFDFIITNPPYHANALRSPSERVNRTRHDSSLTLEEVAACANTLLSSDGRLAVVLPVAADRAFGISCHKYGLIPARRLFVSPTAGSLPHRVLTEYGRSVAVPPETDRLALRDADGAYSPEYLALTARYHKFIR